jgi:hypothetical protein
VIPAPMLFHPFSNPSLSRLFVGKALEHAASAALLGGALVLALHDLTDLDRRLEELCGAAVEADGLALVEIALTVVGGDALLLARVAQAVVGVGHDAHLALDVGNLLLRRHLGTTHSKKRSHFCSCMELFGRVKIS